MILSVEEDSCIGCGLCVNISPTVFEIERNKAFIAEHNIPADLEEKVHEAKDSCPVDAIIIS